MQRPCRTPHKTKEVDPSTHSISALWTNSFGTQFSPCLQADCYRCPVAGAAEGCTGSAWRHQQ